MELNDIAVITLTATGANHLNVYHEYFVKKYPTIILKTDYKEGDDYESSLWDILGIFAEYYHAGREVVFTNLRKK
jgi:hypothetical protein